MIRRNFTRFLSALVLVSALSGCEGGDAKETETRVARAETKVETRNEAPVEAPKAVDPTPADSIDGKVQIAAAVAREISAAPEQADEVLRKHGLDRDRLDAIMFEIAGDPEMTKAYMAARRAR